MSRGMKEPGVEEEYKRGPIGPLYVNCTELPRFLLV